MPRKRQAGGFKIPPGLIKSALPHVIPAVMGLPGFANDLKKLITGNGRRGGRKGGCGGCTKKVRRR